MAEIKQFPKKDLEQIQTEALEDIVEGVKNGDPEAQGMENLGAFLLLDDEHFESLTPVVLENLEKSLQDPIARQQLYFSFQNNGGNIAELDYFYDSLMSDIETLDIGLSEKKKDFLKQMAGIMANAIQAISGELNYTVRIPVEICHEDAKIPAYAHDTDAGMDVYALDDYTINPGETMLIPTGIKMAIPRGYEIQVRPKSGRALKTKLRVANTPGTIDSGYRDEIKVIIENVEPPIKDIASHYEGDKLVVDSILYGSPFYIGKGEKFAQLVLNEVPRAALYQVEKLSSDDDRGGGFGSSGLK